MILFLYNYSEWTSMEVLTNKVMQEIKRYGILEMVIQHKEETKEI